MNPAKLKVVELRAELSARGLDTKGNKAVLVERLQEALDQEEGNEATEDVEAEEEQSPPETAEAQQPPVSEPEQQNSSASDAPLVDSEVAPVEEKNEEPKKPTPQSTPTKEASPTKPIKEPSLEPSPKKQAPTPEKKERKPTVSLVKEDEVTAPASLPEEKLPVQASPEKKVEPTAQEVKQETQEPEAPPPVNQMEVDEDKHGDQEKNEVEKVETISESVAVKKEEEGSEFDADQTQAENGMKMEDDSDSKPNIKSEEDNKMDSDEIKSEQTEFRENRKRRRSSSPQERAPGRSFAVQDREPDYKPEDVTLSWYDSDLNLTVDNKTFYSAVPMTEGGFGFMWAGVRGKFGYKSGSVCYQVKVTELLDVSHLEDEPDPNVLRVGWSAFSVPLQLGEVPLSFGYGGTGKFSDRGKFKDYGKGFGLNDVVTCYLKYTDDEAIIGYSVNEEYLGVACRVSLQQLEGNALAPHILTKNCAFAVNFGQEEPWVPIEKDYVFPTNYPAEEAVAGPSRPDNRSDCEMIMMCGLPGSGKTYWANKYCAEHPEKNYNVIGTNNLIDKMKVMGLPRKANYAGRWDVLIEKCTKCLQRLVDVGCHRRRNYILDQTNVYPAAQRRKMRNFEGFTRKAVVIVPTEEEFSSRIQKQALEEKKDVPESAVLEMKANFTLPDKTIFDEVIYAELQEQEAQELIQQYSKEAAEKGYVRKAGPSGGGPPSKRFRGGDFHHPKNDFRRDRFPGSPASPFRRGSDRGGPRGGGWGGSRGGGGMDRWMDNRNQGNYGRPGDRPGWRGGSSGAAGNGRGPRDYDRGPPRAGGGGGGGYDRNARSGPPPRTGGSYNNRSFPRDNARGALGSGKSRPDGGKHNVGGSQGSNSSQTAQWNNQYSTQGSGQAGAGNQGTWGQQGQWGGNAAQAWNNYQQQWKGYQQGYNQQGYGQGYSTQQYNNWQQYYNSYNQANQQGQWGQSSDGSYSYPNWNWYATQNAGQANTSQPPPSAK